MPDGIRQWYVECEDWSAGPFSTREEAVAEQGRLDGWKCQKPHIIIETWKGQKNDGPIS